MLDHIVSASLRYKVLVMVGFVLLVVFGARAFRQRHGRDAGAAVGQTDQIAPVMAGDAAFDDLRPAREARRRDMCVHGLFIRAYRTIHRNG